MFRLWSGHRFVEIVDFPLLLQCCAQSGAVMFRSWSGHSFVEIFDFQLDLNCCAQLVTVMFRLWSGHRFVVISNWIDNVVPNVLLSCSGYSLVMVLLESLLSNGFALLCPNCYGHVPVMVRS